MNTYWRVHRARAVVDYVIGLREEGRGIRQILSLLARYGVPANATMSQQGHPPVYTWTAAGHRIICLIAHEDRAIYVAVVEPLTPE
ncbi:MAG: hypothetical protein ACOYNY_44655 [Caldilineaceae bacterium]